MTVQGGRAGLGAQAHIATVLSRISGVSLLAHGPSGSRRPLGRAAGLSQHPALCRPLALPSPSCQSSPGTPTSLPSLTRRPRSPAFPGRPGSPWGRRENHTEPSLVQTNSGVGAEWGPGPPDGRQRSRPDGWSPQPQHGQGESPETTRRSLTGGPSSPFSPASPCRTRGSAQARGPRGLRPSSPPSYISSSEADGSWSTRPPRVSLLSRRP